MSSANHVDTGFLLARVEYRDTDLVLTFFTLGLGRIAALARGARKSQKRFGGALEPMHTLRLHFDERPFGELMVLREARLENPRTKLMSHLDTLQAAGAALGWVRKAAPERTSEPAIYEALDQLLDRLNVAPHTGQEPAFLAEFGLFLLNALGFGLRLKQCVRCGRSCARGRPAYVDTRKGGLVCRACGGASTRLEGSTRERLARAAEGETQVLDKADADVARELVEQALHMHMGVERT